MGIQKKKVVIVDDHPIVSQGLVQIMEKIDDLEVFGIASSASEALDLISNEKPLLMVIDISLKDS